MPKQEEAKPKWYQNRLLIVIAITLFFLIALWFTSSVAPVTVNGTMTLSDGYFGSKGSPCDGSGGYSDIIEGAQVTVSNESTSSVVAVSNLSPGKVNDDGDCEFSFKINDVPNSSVYQIEVSHRGKLVYSRKQLEENKYQVELTLGD
jgi:hypothetical protein